MPLQSRARVAALFSLLGIGFLASCGHLPFVDLPAEDSRADASQDQHAQGSDTGDQTVVDAGVSLEDASDGGCLARPCALAYVSDSIGSDSNPGTSAAPVKTIGKGLEIAKGLIGGKAVVVGAGSYDENLTLVEGISVFGGYACSTASCIWTRDIPTHKTTIKVQRSEGVLAPKTVTRKTLLEGLQIIGKSGVANVAITLDGGTPTIRNCTIAGADTGGGAVGTRRSIGIAVRAPSNPEGALIEQNTITAGSAGDDSIGILLDRGGSISSGAAIALARNNVIRAGTAPFTSGIVARASDHETRIERNAITAGTATGASFGAWGITVESAMTIDSNRINVDQAAVGTCASASTFCGGIRSLSSTTVITNNVVFGVKAPRSCAVLLSEAEKAAGLVVLNANTLDGAGLAGDASLSAAVVLQASFGDAAVVGNIRNNILLGGVSNRRFGVFEDSTSNKTAHPAVLDNNDFWNPPSGGDFAYRLWSGNNGQDLPFDQLGTLSAPVPNDNINADPLLDTTFHLGGGSPCSDKGTVTEAPARDFEGDLRTTIDIGADESM
jgi:hypothetical protein